MMKETFYRAKYILALATNTMTDEIRQNYINAVGMLNFVGACAVLGNMVTAVCKMKNSTTENKLQLIESEFSILELGQYLGDYEQYREFFEGLIEIQHTTYLYPEWLDMLKKVANLAESLSEAFKVCIYNVIIDNLVKRKLITQDIDFSSEVIDYLNNSTINVTDYSEFAYMVAEIIGNK